MDEDLLLSVYLETLDRHLAALTASEDAVASLAARGIRFVLLDPGPGGEDDVIRGARLTAATSCCRRVWWASRPARVEPPGEAMRAIRVSSVSSPMESAAERRVARASTSAVSASRPAASPPRASASVKA